MVELVVLKKQIPALARAIASTEQMARSCSGPRSSTLQSDAEALKRRLSHIDDALWETTLYPCHCGRRLTQCPNRVGSLACNLADKGA
ncbi:MAG: hypothetical protein FJZ01_02565 [Candidatus Sericytochromatia bacterium]|nr:hypothetical protein [Candidatus Tanganyikabacteria bacterium]